MKTIGVVAEYNPFHNGHAYHLAESRRIAGEDAAVIAVMSGDFVQRGEAAVYSKYARAEAACRCGADLVVELPLPWALASAEGFAKAAVKILAAMGTDLLSFGSETENLEELAAVADLLRQEGFIDRVRRMLKEHPEQNYAAARQQTAEQILGRKLDCMQRQFSRTACTSVRSSSCAREPGMMRPEPESMLRHQSFAVVSAQARASGAVSRQLRNRFLPGNGKRDGKCRIKNGQTC